jgi:CRP/FNR family transcriptional regulator, cyclic AMP receptor protein
VDQTFKLFSECVLFRKLESQHKEALFTRVRTRDVSANETIFASGSPGDSMMIVLRGNVQISVATPQGRPRVLATRSPGDMFGEVACLDGEARLADAIAMTDGSLAVVDREDVLAFLEETPGAWQNIVSGLCERLRHMIGGNPIILR